MAMALQHKPKASTSTAGDGKDEADLYLGNISPVAPDFDDPLGRWKQNQALRNTWRAQGEIFYQFPV
ncbi:hypothetical protein B0H19DRAFT_1259227 [Mycena capillaripes]|nr:hypothetical protein B0H19DRAFT_1259227 [Mycena capillaripes]